MKPYWQVSARKIALGFIGWFIATNVLVALAHLLGWWPATPALFLCIVFLPGAALLRIMRLGFTNTTTSVIYGFGLSILVLMLGGLAANQTYLLGVARPLDPIGAITAWDLATATLIALGIYKNRQPIRIKFEAFRAITQGSWLFFGLGLLLPCLAVFGAFRLNNGSDGVLAALTLCYAAALIIFALLRRHHLPDGLLTWFVFVLGLTILLMTSMRGWDIVGHDIEREFRVFTLANMHGRWDIDLDRNPYNACLSINILPQMFASILNISGLVVFKIILQIIFAVCPAILFIMFRQYVTKLAALVGSLLFICYPTFINDSMMLTRQGVAYLFFALAVLVVSNTNQKGKFKILFLVCALGAVLSHYSTAYMFVSLFVLAAITKLCIDRWRRKAHSPTSTIKHTVVSPLIALVLFFMTFTWYAQITATSGGLTETFRKSFANIPQFFSNDNKSADTSGALLFAGGKTQVQLYESYLTTSQSSAINAAQDIPTLVNDDLPPTDIGKAARTVGIDPSFIAVWRQNFARILQAVAVAAVLYAVYNLFRGKSQKLSVDFICLDLSGIALLAIIVILPILSMNYGILRAFQQGLIFLLLPMVILLSQMTQRMWPQLRTALATLGITLIFFLFTGMFAQILGGASPSLGMNNTGLYYGLYYSPEADARAFTWIKQNIDKKSDVRAANFNKAFMHDPDYVFSRAGILPSQVEPNTYVYLDQSQVLKQKVYTYYDGSSLIMTFPTDFYDITKNQIYSTSSTRIYR